MKNRVKGVVKAEDWPKAAELPEEWQGLFQPSTNRDLLFKLQPLSEWAAEAKASQANQETLLTIQVGSFRALRPARAELERLRKKGLDVFIQINAINSITWYRICHGYFRDEALAKETARQLVRSRLAKSYRIIRVREEE